MELNEILAHFGWHMMRIYTICAMFCRDTYNNYFLEYFQNINQKENDEVFPFTIILTDIISAFALLALSTKPLLTNILSSLSFTFIS